MALSPTYHYINETLSSGNTGSREIDWTGGPGTFGAQGTWDSTTIELQFSINGSTWTPVPGSGLSRTSDGMANFQIFACKLRVQRTVAGGATFSVKVRVAPAIPGYFTDGDFKATG
jgi:hypothetical protein